MNKKARDNRANQMNPNNIAYYKSRMGNFSAPKTKVVHHHHHHHNGKAFTCPFCGRQGTLRTTFLGSIKCNYCGSKI